MCQLSMNDVIISDISGRDGEVVSREKSLVDF